MGRQRFTYIDRTKGLAIALVVLGHLVAREMPPGDGGQWYLVLKDAIYAFHMPLFMAVSGLVYGLSWQPSPTWQDDLRDTRRRVARLLPAYLLFGALIFVGKWTFQHLTGAVDNPVRGIEDFGRLLLQPGISFTSFLWYIYALSLLYLLFPLAFRLVKGRVWVLLAVSAWFWLLPSGTWLAWDRLQTLAPFFLLGVWAGRHHERTLQVLRSLWLPALLGFAVLLPLASYGPPGFRWALATVSVLGLPGLLLRTERLPLSKLETLGAYTLIIYLTNTIIIGLMKVAAVKTGLWQSNYLLPLAGAMWIAATVGPIWLKRYLLPKIPPLDRITS